MRLGRQTARIGGSASRNPQTTWLEGYYAQSVYDHADGLIRRYVPGAGLDDYAAYTTGTGGSISRDWPVVDPLGSIVGITNGSATATTINTYDEYGVPGASFSGRFGHAGSMYLNRAMAAPWNMRNRQYNPTLGRFMQTDPIGIQGGVNLYGYVGNDPVNLIDPWGLRDCVPTPTVSCPGDVDAPSCREGNWICISRHALWLWWTTNSQEDLSRYFEYYGYAQLLEDGRQGAVGQDSPRCAVWQAGAMYREAGRVGQGYGITAQTAGVSGAALASQARDPFVSMQGTGRGLAFARGVGRVVIGPSMIAEYGGAGLQAAAGDWNPLAESSAGLAAGAVAGRGGIGPVADVASGLASQAAGAAANGRGPFSAVNPCAR